MKPCCDVASTSPRYISSRTCARAYSPLPSHRPAVVWVQVGSSRPSSVPRRAPTIPVHGALLPHSCVRSRRVAPRRRRLSDREMEYERPYTNHRATVLPGAPFPFFLASPFRPLFSLYPTWPLSFFHRSSFSTVLWQPIISLIYRIPSHPSSTPSLSLSFCRICVYFFDPGILARSSAAHLRT